MAVERYNSLGHVDPSLFHIPLVSPTMRDLIRKAPGLPSNCLCQVGMTKARCSLLKPSQHMSHNTSSNFNHLDRARLHQVQSWKKNVIRNARCITSSDSTGDSSRTLSQCLSMSRHQWSVLQVRQRGNPSSLTGMPTGVMVYGELFQSCSS